MKIRNGFVSNSSSSSFLIYGTTIYNDEFKKNLIKFGLQNSKKKIEQHAKFDTYYTKDKTFKWLQELFQYSKSQDIDDEYDDFENDMFSLYDICNILEINCYCPFEEEYYVGYSWDSIRDYQTGLQFKNRVKQDIKKKLSFLDLKDEDFTTYQEAWHD